MAIPTHLRLEFVTPERALVHEDVDEVEIPGEDGYFGVLPGHAPLLAALKPGELWYRRGAEKKFAFIAGGFAEVLPDRVAILAQVAERAEDIDIQRAEASKRRAEDRLARPTADMDAERARVALLRSLMRLQVSARRAAGRY
jgi:F-type H+-transporting ATPase subunit epsilon